jgi:hypothetical protein
MFGGRTSIVADNIDTLILNAKLRQDFPLELARQLEVLKEASQDAEEDLVTVFTLAGERLFIKPHGAGKQWRWILHSPGLHLDVGLGKHTQIVAKARLSAAYLWATEIGDALTQIHAFLTPILGSEPFLQVSEAHLCVDVAGWELAVVDAAAFVMRGRRRGLRLEDDDETPPGLQINLNGRRCGALDFSKGAAHSCCIYDKTKQIIVLRKDWMHEVWKSHGWDGESRVTRVEFRYKRECLREMGVEEAYTRQQGPARPSRPSVYGASLAELRRMLRSPQRCRVSARTNSVPPAVRHLQPISWMASAEGGRPHCSAAAGGTGMRVHG